MFVLIEKKTQSPPEKSNEIEKKSKFLYEFHTHNGTHVFVVEQSGKCKRKCFF